MVKEKEFSIGVDIGGTKIAAILWDGKKIWAEKTIPTPADNLKHFLIELEKLVKYLIAQGKTAQGTVNSVGLGFPGVIDFERRVCLKMPNVPILDNAEVCAWLEKKFRLTAKLDNDANNFTRAEALAGAGKGHKNVFGVIVGTGIGGAWWFNNEIYTGAHGSAGEIGVTIVDFESGLQLENAYHKMMYFNPEKVAKEAKGGDVLSREIYELQGRFLGLSFANVVNIMDPEIIILGGGLTKSAKLFFPIMDKTMRENTESSKAAALVKVTIGQLGDMAGAIGAALLVS